MINVRIPNICQKELTYSLNIIFNEFLGLVYNIETYEGEAIEITENNNLDNPSKLTLCAEFFFQANNHWLKSKSMPALPLKTWMFLDDEIEVNLVESGVPILYGSPGFVKNGNHIHLNLDIFGSIFFMLTRYEELIVKERDQHDRFTAYFSHAYKNNYLNRPLVDEYVEILKQCMKMLWPGLKFKEKKFTINTSHDVDQVSRYQTRRNFYQYLRAIGGDLSRGFIKDLIYSPISYLDKKSEFSSNDPYNTFDWLMGISEKNNIKSTFNFICGKSSKFNSDYDVDDIKIENLIKKINDRGHLIGLHPSYDCYLNHDLINKELIQLKNTFKYLNIKQKEITSRMHYLRWKTTDTLVILNNAGIKKDTTLGYADYCGFRCGTSHTYQGYDLLHRKILNIMVEPLIIMDGTLFGYMKLNHEQAHNISMDLKKKCQKMKGQFNILWHNSYLRDQQHKEFYQSLIQN